MLVFILPTQLATQSSLISLLKLLISGIIDLFVTVSTTMQIKIL